MTPRQSDREAAHVGERRRRADAERSVRRILDAALDALAGDPEVSMADLARRAGVARATIYVHFPTREVLVDAVTERAIADVTRAMTAASPDRDDALEALERVLRVAWRELGRFHALVGINVRRTDADLRRLHGPAFAILQPLVERGEHDGTFRSDVPAAWHISMLLALIHAASAEVQSERMPVDTIESALVATALGAVRAAPESAARER